MRLEINADVLRKNTKLMICTPMYGGDCKGVYADASIKLAQILASRGIPHKFHFLFNESLITRARNYCVDEFLRAEDGSFTHMIFIDADIEYDPLFVLSMLWLQTDDSPYDVFGAPYPKKNISWEKIVMAVNKGLADENPAELENYVGDFVFNFPPGEVTFNPELPVEVMELGTGFMMIRRNTFNRLEKAYPNLKYVPDHARSAEFDGSRKINLFFDCAVHPETERYLSEDYRFCHLVRDAGMKVWLCPWMNLRHFGNMSFTGNFHKMIANGITLTANLEELKKMKENKK